jgi:hypothetical protein
MVPLRRPATALLVLVAAAGVVVACGGGAGAADDEPASASTPTSWDRRLQPIAAKVAKLRKLKFLHPVAAEFLDDAAFEKKVSIDKGKLTKQDKREAKRAQAQLRAVGLIGPDVDIVDAMTSLQSSGVAAYYDPGTKKITVKGKTTDDVATRVTIAHELTHALQDQHFDLKKLQQHAAEQHASTPLRTLVEGDAVRIQHAYVSSLSQADQRAYEREQASTSDQAQSEIAAQHVPESLSVVFEAPYDLGPTMLEALIAKEGERGVDRLFEHPPTADSSYLSPSTVLEHRKFADVAPPAVSAGEKRAGTADVFGAFMLFEVLASRLDPSVALTAADAWGGDATVTFTRHTTTCLRTRFVGTNRDGTATIADALAQWAAQMPAGAAHVDRARGGVTLTACDPGAKATDAPNRAVAALGLVGTRNGFLATLLAQRVPVKAAQCAADAVVREPAFAPLLSDPDVELSDTALSSLRAVVQQDLKRCASSRGGA